MPRRSASSAISGRGSAGGDPPRIVESKAPILAPLAAGLPGGYRYLAVRDLAAEIEWAKARRMGPADYAARRRRPGPRCGPLPRGPDGRALPALPDRARAGRPDRLRGHARAHDRADRVRRRRRRRGPRSLSLVLGRRVPGHQPAPGRRCSMPGSAAADDLAVVGDEDQTIYTFTGATSDYLTGFATRYPDARTVALETNYRSTPQVLDLANRVLAAGRGRPRRTPARSDAAGRPKRLVASLPGRPRAVDRRVRIGRRRSSPRMIDAIRSLARAGTPYGSMAVLVRTNAQLPPIERALGVGRHRVPRPRRGILRPARGPPRDRRRRGRLPGGPATTPLVERLARRLRVASSASAATSRPQGEAAGERHAAVVTLLELAEDLVQRRSVGRAGGLPGRGRTADRAVEAGGDADRRRAAHLPPRQGPRMGRRLPACARGGQLPIRQATEPAELAEERRLLYVGITRARRHLWLSWATRRTGTTGREGRRSRSRFLDGLVPAPAWAGRGGATGPMRHRHARPRGSTRASARRSRTRCVPGGRPGPGPTPIAPFIVFHDSTIEAIAERRPRTIAELRRVPGVGPTKLDRYGEEILAVVAQDGPGGTGGNATTSTARDD